PCEHVYLIGIGGDLVGEKRPRWRTLLAADGSMPRFGTQTAGGTGPGGQSGPPGPPRTSIEAPSDLAIPCPVASPQGPTPFQQARPTYTESEVISNDRPRWRSRPPV